VFLTYVTIFKVIFNILTLIAASTAYDTIWFNKG